MRWAGRYAPAFGFSPLSNLPTANLAPFTPVTCLSTYHHAMCFKRRGLWTWSFATRLHRSDLHPRRPCLSSNAPTKLSSCTEMRTSTRRPTLGVTATSSLCHPRKCYTLSRSSPCSTTPQASDMGSLRILRLLVSVFFKRMYGRMCMLGRSLTVPF